MATDESRVGSGRLGFMRRFAGTALPPPALRGVAVFGFVSVAILSAMNCARARVIRLPSCQTSMKTVSSSTLVT